MIEDGYDRTPKEILDKFDMNSKVCVCNCSPGTGDPRSRKERRYQCSDCEPVRPVVISPETKLMSALTEEQLEILNNEDIEVLSVIVNYNLIRV